MPSTNMIMMNSFKNEAMASGFEGCLLCPEAAQCLELALQLAERDGIMITCKQFRGHMRTTTTATTAADAPRVKCSR